MVLNLFGPESLKEMHPEVKFTARRHLEMWPEQDTVKLIIGTLFCIKFSILCYHIYENKHSITKTLKVLSI